ncbi:UNVERIFIED_CONTAM: hypothetical protein HDU68_002660 [Siphonaria sp. JEL0065]|nr:hypothetical protein HDU68_002660 [Siphonaria sp. JEL0065]
MLSHGCIYVIDAADPSRFAESSEALKKVYLDSRMIGKPLVILANKQNNPSAIKSIETLAQQLNLTELLTNTTTAASLPALRLFNQHEEQEFGLLGNNILIQPCSTNTINLKRGSGLFSAISWKSTEICDVNIKSAFLWLLERVHIELATLSPRIYADSANQRIEWAHEREAQKRRVLENKAKQEEQQHQADELENSTLASGVALNANQESVSEKGEGEGQDSNETMQLEREAIQEAEADIEPQTQQQTNEYTENQEQQEDIPVEVLQELFELPKKCLVQPSDIEPMPHHAPLSKPESNSTIDTISEALALDPLVLPPPVMANEEPHVETPQQIEPITSKQSASNTTSSKEQTASVSTYNTSNRQNHKKNNTPPQPAQTHRQQHRPSPPQQPQAKKETNFIAFHPTPTPPKESSPYAKRPPSAKKHATSRPSSAPNRKQKPAPQQRVISQESISVNNPASNTAATTTTAPPIIPISLAASSMSKKSLLPPIGGKAAHMGAVAVDGVVDLGERVVNVKVVEQVDSAFCLESSF